MTATVPVMVSGVGKITPSHRSRLALIYVRQSTLVQVRDNVESATRQYGLAEWAVELGWPPQQVVVVDADLGCSGRFGSHREGFRELVSRVCLGEVGAVLGLEVSRLARSSAEVARLVELARLTDTLLVDGLVYDLDRQVVVDPDEQVRGAVADLFAEFARTGSAFGVVAAFAETGRLFPQRAWGGAWAGQLKWGKLTHARVVQALKQPGYAGAYTYGRSRDVRQVRPDGSIHTLRRSRPRAEWQVLITDHHQGYITWQQFLDHEAKLAANHTASGARPPREGLALCQGIIWCGACGHQLATRYPTRKAPTYSCLGRRDHNATPACRTVVAATVDQAVAALLLEAVTPGQIELALAAADEVAARHTRTHRAAELQAERARYHADRAERAFSLVEPENRLVARSLEARWEQALAALAEAEHALATARQARPPLPDRAALHALAADLPALWDHPATSPRDRKRLLRTLIADVHVLPEADPTRCRIGVRWHTGATDEICVARRGHGQTPPAAVDLVRRLGATTTDDILAATLNAAGLHTGKGKPFTPSRVHLIRESYQIRAPRTVPLQAGEISVPDAARRLGVSKSALYYWLGNGLLPGRQAPSRRWCIPWNPETEAQYRATVAASIRLKPRPAQPVAEEGAV
jgi:hypothetical protein